MLVESTASAKAVALTSSAAPGRPGVASLKRPGMTASYVAPLTCGALRPGLGGSASLHVELVKMRFDYPVVLIRANEEIRTEHERYPSKPSSSTGRPSET